jgi:alpha-glucosidase
VDGVDLCAGVDQSSVKSGPHGDNVDETYPTRGVHSTARNRFQQFHLTLRHVHSGTAYRMDVRVFDDGVAYRFVLDGTPGQVRTPDERSVFTLPAGSTVWSHGLRGHYEGEYSRREGRRSSRRRVGRDAAHREAARQSGYASISESNLVNYSGFAFETAGERSS